MRTVKLALFGLLFLLGSNFSYAVDYGKPVSDSQVYLLLINSTTNPDHLSGAAKGMITKADAERLKAMGCYPNHALWAAGAIPILTAIAGRVFDKYQEGKLDKLKKLKKDSRNEYSQTVNLTSTELSKITCAVLVRYTKEGGKTVTGLKSIIKFNHYANQAGAPTAFSFRPIKLKVNNTTVKTITNKKDPKSAKITVAIGVAAKVVTKDQNGLTSIAPLGATSVGISSVLLDGKEQCAVKNKDFKCDESDLIPHISSDTVVALTVSVSEVGHVGIDFDKAEAEIAAIKAAYGPALKESLTALLKDE